MSTKKQRRKLAIGQDPLHWLRQAPVEAQAMTWYRCDTILDVLCVADQFPDGVIAIGPRNLVLFHLQELLTDRAAMKKWAEYSALAYRDRKAYISLFTDYQSALQGSRDRVLHCGGCALPMLDHLTRSIMDAPLEERLAYCLRAHVNAEKQGRKISDNVQRMSVQALNDFEEQHRGEAQPAPHT